MLYGFSGNFCLKGEKLTKPETKKRLRLLTILLLFAVFAAATVNNGFSEPATRTDIIISDSIAPMKLEIDSKTGNETETRTVTLTNTGEAATEYICYIEQTGGKKDIGADFELSESKIVLLPGDSGKLKIEIPAQAIKTDSTDAEYKLKIIRNPETQTPVGYIIPIKFANPAETEPDSKTAGGKSGTGIGLTADPKNENERAIENKTGGKTENNHPTEIETDDKGYGNSFMKKSGIILLLVFLMLFASAAGIIIQKKKKKGKD